MTARTGRVVGGLLMVFLTGWVAGPASGQDKAPPKFSGRLMTYAEKKGTITQVTVLRPTPAGKTLQDVYMLDVTADTKFVVTDGAKKTELTAKTVLTDPATKDRMKVEPGGTLGDFAGLPVDVETKGKAVSSITFKAKKK